MARKINIMIDVPEDIYDSVVAPYKEKRKFSKLVIQLLDAFATNSSIYSYINGIMDGLEEESVESLLKDLNSMSQSLTMMNMLGSQAEVILNNGTQEFEEVNRREKEFSSAFTESDLGNTHKDSSISRGEVESIMNQTLADFKNDFMRDMQAMLSQMGNVGSNKGYSEVVPEVKETVKAVNEPVYKPVKEARVMEKVPTPEDAKKATDALNSLMGSFSW